MSTKRPKLEPLHGKPLMVHVAFNVEYWPFEQPMPRGILPAPHGKSPVPDIANFSWVHYGMVAGMPRCIDLMTERGLPASALTNAACADIYPSCVDAMLEADWEFVGHGWLQRSLQFEDDEEDVIVRSLARLKSLTGKQTRGWLGPGLGESNHTPDLLKKHGIEYLCDWYIDDLPSWMRTELGPLIAMPYTVELNDVPIWVIEKQSSDEMYKRLQWTLETFDREKQQNPKVITLALHPHVIGVPHRATWLARMLDELMARDDTIFVTGSQIADWFLEADGTGGTSV